MLWLSEFKTLPYKCANPEAQSSSVTSPRALMFSLISTKLTSNNWEVCAGQLTLVLSQGRWPLLPTGCMLHAWQLSPAFFGLLPLLLFLRPAVKASNPRETWLLASGRQGCTNTERTTPTLCIAFSVPTPNFLITSLSDGHRLYLFIHKE